MSVHVEPCHPHFGARVTGFSIADGVSDTDFADIRAAFEKYSVIVFPDQPMDRATQVGFSERFGELEIAFSRLGEDEIGKRIAYIANVDAEGKIVAPTNKTMLGHKANSLWHTDSTFKPRTALASLLYAEAVPPSGGDTEYVSTRVAWQQLPDAKKAQIENLWAIHDFNHSRNKIAPGINPSHIQNLTPDQRRPLVRTNPVNGEKSIYIASHAKAVEGMEQDAALELIDELTQWCTRDEFIYTHKWQVGEMVMWDNRATMHRGRGWNETEHVRKMHRATVIDPEVLDANFGDEKTYAEAQAAMKTVTCEIEENSIP